MFHKDDSSCLPSPVALATPTNKHWVDRTYRVTKPMGYSTHMFLCSGSLPPFTAANSSFILNNNKRLWFWRKGKFTLEKKLIHILWAPISENVFVNDFAQPWVEWTYRATKTTVVYIHYSCSALLPRASPH